MDGRQIVTLRFLLDAASVKRSDDTGDDDDDIDQSRSRILVRCIILIVSDKRLCFHSVCLFVCPSVYEHGYCECHRKFSSAF